MGLGMNTPVARQYSKLTLKLVRNELWNASQTPFFRLFDDDAKKPFWGFVEGPLCMLRIVFLFFRAPLLNFEWCIAGEKSNLKQRGFLCYLGWIISPVLRFTKFANPGNSDSLVAVCGGRWLPYQTSLAGVKTVTSQTGLIRTNTGFDFSFENF